ncbi:MAG: HAMP domain-containing histidine kinase [Rhizobiales bacterium]|nr:HAMP domain-containing histidine kinase [Hyphomicrobiales bacterium]
MDLHGGSVVIDSAPGRGTTVTCVFPVAQAQKQSAA